MSGDTFLSIDVCFLMQLSSVMSVTRPYIHMQLFTVCFDEQEHKCEFQYQVVFTRLLSTKNCKFQNQVVFTRLLSTKNFYRTIKFILICIQLFCELWQLHTPSKYIMVKNAKAGSTFVDFLHDMFIKLLIGNLYLRVHTFLIVSPSA